MSRALMMKMALSMRASGGCVLDVMALADWLKRPLLSPLSLVCPAVASGLLCASACNKGVSSRGSAVDDPACWVAMLRNHEPTGLLEHPCKGKLLFFFDKRERELRVN